MSTEHKHTPGPWGRRKEWRSDSRALEIYPASRKVKPPLQAGSIARVEEYGTSQESLANARLIAASPALLEALENLVAAEGEFTKDTGIPLDDMVSDAVKEAKKAIALATGKEGA